MANFADDEMVRDCLSYLTQQLAFLDQNTQRNHSEKDELVPTFNFKVYQVGISRRMKKREAKWQSKNEVSKFKNEGEELEKETEKEEMEQPKTCL